MKNPSDPDSTPLKLTDCCAIWINSSDYGEHKSPLKSGAWGPTWECVDLYRFNLDNGQYKRLLTTDEAERRLVTMKGFKASRARKVHRKRKEAIARHTSKCTPYKRKHRLLRRKLEAAEHNEEAMSYLWALAGALLRTTPFSPSWLLLKDLLNFVSWILMCVHAWYILLHE